jgi:hypothetical protein
MIEPTPALMVFGLDPDDNPRAGRFAEPDAHAAVSAADLLGYQVLGLSDAELLDVLPNGNVYARGIGFIRRVKRTVFEKLVAVAAPEKASL